MKLAELCDTATSYIGEIEIGRRFPSLKLIEKIAGALNVEPYEFFIPRLSTLALPPSTPPFEDTAAADKSAANPCCRDIDSAVSLLCRLPGETRLRIIHTLSGS